VIGHDRREPDAGIDEVGRCHPRLVQCLPYSDDPGSDAFDHPATVSSSHVLADVVQALVAGAAAGSGPELLDGEPVQASGVPDDQAVMPQCHRDACAEGVRAEVTVDERVGDELAYCFRRVLRLVPRRGDRERRRQVLRVSLMSGLCLDVADIAALRAKHVDDVLVSLSI
jgi:hypothetical protein